MYNTRGLIKYAELGDVEYALADYDLAIEIDPTFAAAYNCRGLLKTVKLMDIAGALADYVREASLQENRAIALDPHLSEAYYNRGTLKHKELGDPVGALADYDRAIDLDPHLASAYFLRSLLKRDLLNDLLGAANDYDFPKGTLREWAIVLDPKIFDLDGYPHYNLIFNCKNGRQGHNSIPPFSHLYENSENRPKGNNIHC